ncbi:MAG: aconitase X swivel domain-containing protein [Nocardioidaceae bacterium]
MTNRTFAVTQATGDPVQAPVLIDPVTFSPRYDLDRVDGTFSRSDHPLNGASLGGRILAAPGVQGGVAGGWAFLAMGDLGVGPAALIFGAVNPVMVQGAVTAGLTIVAGIDERFFTAAHTGDVVRIEPDERTVHLVG